MDPISQFIKTHQYHEQDQAMLSFSPLFTNYSDFFPGANDYEHQVIPEINTSTFPIDHVSAQQYSPNSTHFGLDSCYYQPYWDADHEVLTNPTPAVLPQHSPPPTVAVAPTAKEEVRKKMHHNASERVRRRRLSVLFAGLSSLLPGADKKKKQTAPATVERVISYIPELRNRVERLTQRKLLLLSTPANDVVSTKSITVTANTLTDDDVSITFSAVKTTFISISYVLRLLEEEDGVNVVSVSSSESSPSGRLLYHIHLHLEEKGSSKVDLELLRMKLLTSTRKCDDRGACMIGGFRHEVPL